MPTATGRLHYYHGAEQLRYVGSVVVTAFATAVFGSVGTLISFFDRRGHMTQACARGWARTFLWIHGIRLTVRGASRLNDGDHYVFAANHNSQLDIPAMLVALPVRFRMFAKESLFRIPFLGWYMRRVGYIPVPRGARRAADMNKAVEALRQGSVLVFPEGTRTPEQEIARFRKGGFHLAREAGVPIVPIAIINSGRLAPRRALFAMPGVIEVRIGSPLPDDGQQSLAALAADCRSRVAEMARSTGMHA